MKRNSAQTAAVIALLSALVMVGWQLAKSPAPKQAASLPDSGRDSTASLPPANLTGSGAAADHTVPPAAQNVPVPLFEISEWRLLPPDSSPLRPEESLASRQVNAITTVKRQTLPDLASLKVGQRISLPVRAGGPVVGIVNLVTPPDEGWVRVGGALTDGVEGEFSLGQKGAEFTGMTLRRDTSLAYVMETLDSGIVEMREKPLSSVVCMALLPPREFASPASPSAPAGPPGEVVMVPDLDSLPSATNVIYLDFDGEIVTDPGWNDGLTIYALPPKLNGRYINTAQITETWRRVSEDFAPFNISVTTILSRYTAAGAGRRMRCIITPTDIAMPGAGGVAYLNSFDRAGGMFSSTVPCWAFVGSSYTPAIITEIISHEIGHTLGLSHDGRLAVGSSPRVEYYNGHGNWGPIMGAAYGRPVTQWSKGEYSSPTNTEDDLAIITNSANGFGARTDEAPGTAPGTTLANTGQIARTGSINGATDVDLYRVVVNPGTLSLTATPSSHGPNLDLVMELRGSDGTTVLTKSDPAGLAKTFISQTIAGGTYFVALYGRGEGTASSGYTRYGSAGGYTLTGSFPAVPDFAPSISQPPLSQTVPPGRTVTFRVVATSNIKMTYQWTKDNVDIPGKTSDTLTLSKVTPASQGAYRCRVSNSVGSTTSAAATLNVNHKPIITLHPASNTTPAGTAVTFNVAASGFPAPTYQWQFNGVDIPGATAASRTVTNPQWAQAGSYRCLVTNSFGTTASRSATLTVQSLPVWLQPLPASTLAPLNGTLKLSVRAGGTPPLQYKWFRNNVLIDTATKPDLVIPGVTTGTAGSYRCEVRNDLGTASSTTSVTVQAPPSIISQPGSVTVRRGAKIVLSVGVVGAPALRYEWLRNGIKVATSTSLPVTATATATYQCIVTNHYGSATSSVATVTVRDVPLIDWQPVSQARPLGGTASFTVYVRPDSTSTFTYAWMFNGVPLPGATNSTLNLSSLTAAHAGSYSCVITNQVGKTTSASARLTIQTAPVFTLQPLATTVFELSPATLTGGASGSAAISYQWEKAAVATPSSFVVISGATSPSFKLAKAAPADDAFYRLRATNKVGTAYSNSVRLTVRAITTPVVSGFQPPSGKSGHLIRITGSGLHWTTGVTLLKSPTSSVSAKFQMVSDTELLITVPTGAITSPLRVISRGGSTASAASFAVTTTGDTNDAFTGARILPGNGGTAAGSNTTFTAQSGEPAHCSTAAVRSAWFEWTPSVSGSYWVTTAGSKFDTRLSIYTGSAINSLTLAAFNDDYTVDYYNGSYWETRELITSKAYVFVTAGTRYRIAIDGFSGTSSTASGSYSLAITRIASYGN